MDRKEHRKTVDEDDLSIQFKEQGEMRPALNI